MSTTVEGSPARRFSEIKTWVQNSLGEIADPENYGWETCGFSAKVGVVVGTDPSRSANGAEVIARLTLPTLRAGFVTCHGRGKHVYPHADRIDWTGAFAAIAKRAPSANADCVRAFAVYLCLVRDEGYDIPFDSQTLLHLKKAVNSIMVHQKEASQEQAVTGPPVLGSIALVQAPSTHISNDRISTLSQKPNSASKDKDTFSDDNTMSQNRFSSPQSIQQSQQSTPKRGQGQIEAPRLSPRLARLRSNLDASLSFKKYTNSLQLARQSTPKRSREDNELPRSSPRFSKAQDQPFLSLPAVKKRKTNTTNKTSLTTSTPAPEASPSPSNPPSSPIAETPPATAPKKQPEEAYADIKRLYNFEDVPEDNPIYQIVLGDLQRKFEIAHDEQMAHFNKVRALEKDLRAAKSERGDLEKRVRDAEARAQVAEEKLAARELEVSES